MSQAVRMPSCVTCPTKGQLMSLQIWCLSSPRVGHVIQLHCCYKQIYTIASSIFSGEQHMNTPFNNLGMAQPNQ